MEERSCVFCQIVAKRSPAMIVYEDDSSVAFLDIRPANVGHTLVVPRQHFETIMDIPNERIKEVAVVIRKISIGIVKGMQADGLNILQNNKTSQIIPHLHFHLIPRYKGDDLRLGVLRQRGIDGNTMRQAADKIRAFVPPE